MATALAVLMRFGAATRKHGLLRRLNDYPLFLSRHRRKATPTRSPPPIRLRRKATATLGVPLAISPHRLATDVPDGVSYNLEPLRTTYAAALMYEATIGSGGGQRGRGQLIYTIIYKRECKFILLVLMRNRLAVTGD